jgi:hypothetical protein
MSLPVLTATIIKAMALMMDAVQTSETSVNSYQSAWRYKLEDSHLLSSSRLRHFQYPTDLLPSSEILFLFVFSFGSRGISLNKVTIHRMYE